MCGTCSTHTRDEKYKILVGKPEDNRALETYRLIWEDNYKMTHQGAGCEIVDWIHVAQDRD